MNQNFQQDAQGRLLAVISEVSATLDPDKPLPVATGATIAEIDDIKAIAVVAAGGEVSAVQEGEWTVTVEDAPATGFPSLENQVTANGHLSSMKDMLTSISDRLPAALINGTLITTEANSTLIRTSLDHLDNKTPGMITSDPVPNTQAPPVRIVPAFVSGKELHVQTSAGIANGANKILFGLNNSTTKVLYISRVRISNTQTSNISGSLVWMYCRRSTGLITGFTELTQISSPALLLGYRDPQYALPSGLVFLTAGTFGGTVHSLDSCQWSTDAFNPANQDMTAIIAAYGIYHDTFSFEDDPIVVPNGYSFGVQCDALMADGNPPNGQTLVDLNIRFAE